MCIACAARGNDGKQAKQTLAQRNCIETIRLGLNYSASTNATLAASLSPAELNVSRTAVIAVSAMEGVGLAEAVLKYNLLATTARPVPYTNVRAMSNWLHQSLKQVEVLKARAQHAWLPGLQARSGSDGAYRHNARKYLLAEPESAALMAAFMLMLWYTESAIRADIDYTSAQSLQL